MRVVKTDLDRLNELIDWYERWKPEAGKVIDVRMPDKQLAIFAKPIAGKPAHWSYRDRELRQVP